MKTSCLYCFLFILSALTPENLQAADAIILSDTLEQMGIRKNHLGIFEDRGSRYTIRDVCSKAFADSFSYSNSDPVSMNPESAYWFRFTFINRASSDKKWLLEFFDHNISYLSLYLPDKNGKFRAIHNGNLLPFDTRLFHHKNFEFDLPVNPGDTVTAYMHFRSENKNVLVPVLRSYELFFSYALGEYYLLGLFYGILLMMAIYNLFLFAALKKRVYLYYVLYVLSFSIFSKCQNGLSFQYLWPDYPDLNRYAFAIALYSAILFALLFTKKFLNLKERHPSLNKLIKLVIAARSVVFLYGLFLAPKVLYAFYLDIIPLFIIYFTGILAYMKGDRAARYFIIAYSILFLGFFIKTLEEYGHIRSGILTVYSLNLGIVLEILLLSLSLADRMKSETLKREEAQRKVMEEMKEKEFLKDKINRELEEKVAERTEQLAEANARLKEQSDKITRMNLDLDLANAELKQNVRKISRNRVVKLHADLDEFMKVFPDELSCYRFIEELKSENGFRCKKCDSESYGRGKNLFDRRCTRCGYNESITANTVFHKLKFPIVKAFYLIYLVSQRNTITAEELSRILSLRKTTCSVFKKKVRERIVHMGEIKSWDVLILDKSVEKATG